MPLTHDHPAPGAFQSVTSDEVIASIRAAFDDLAIPAEVDILSEGARSYLDAIEMRAALAGKHWSEVAIADLFYHRCTVAELGAIGLRAYIAAFLLAALAADHRSPDIFQYTLFALYPLEDAERDRTRERLSLLSPAQRIAIAKWLRYFAVEVREARRVLVLWHSTSG